MDEITVTIPMLMRVRTEQAHMQIEGEFTFRIAKGALKDGMVEIIEAMKASPITVSTKRREP